MIRDPNLVLNLPLYQLDGSSFMDKSAYGHICTVTGATWGLQGRTFDGDDYIELVNDGSTSSPLNFTTGNFSGIANFKVTNLDLNKALFFRGSLNADGYRWFVDTSGRIVFDTEQSGAQQETQSSAGTIALNTWYSIGFTRNGATVKFYKAGVETGYTTSGTHINPATSSRTAKIGVHDDKASYPYIGIIGEVLMYNRILTVAEFQNYHLSTEWRFQ